MKKYLFGLILALCSVCALAGDTKPINLSLVPDVAIFDRDTTINGVALSIWGENPQHALALGLANGSTGDSAGFSWSLALNYAHNYHGVQWALVNYNTGDFVGWQNGLVNYTEGSMTGFQWGAVNYAGKLTGLQLGFLNFAKAAESGLQIGFVNVIHDNQAWFGKLPNELAPAFVIVNWRF